MTGTESYEFLAYRPEHKPGMLELARHLWSDDPALNLRHLEWKYEKNPYLRETLLHVVLHDGKLVGMRGFFGTRWEAGHPTRTETMLCGGDVLVDPAHRGQRLATRLLEFALQDSHVTAPWLVGLSANPTTRLIGMGAGWESTTPLLRLRCENGSSGTGANNPEARPFDQLDARLLPPGGRVKSGVSVTDSPRAGEMADLIGRIGHDGRIRHVRDEAYFEWRLGNPRSDYRFFYLHRGRLRGYLIVQMRVAPLSRRNPRMVDWEGETPSDRRELLEAFVGLVTGRVELTTGPLAPVDQELLGRAGFRERTPESDTPPEAILIRPGPSGPGSWLLGDRDVRTLSNWDYRELYSDNV